MTDQTELRRVLAELDKSYAWCVETGKGGRPSTEALADAARLLREIARDFRKHADNDGDCISGWYAGRRCNCGLDAARGRWRLGEGG